MPRTRPILGLLLALPVLAACAPPPGAPMQPGLVTPDVAQSGVTPADLAQSGRLAKAEPAAPDPAAIAALADAITALDPAIAAAEAARAARIAHVYPLDLARRYEIEDPPYWHNVKVLNGTKPRGTCWHFAEDLQARLAQEGFRTLSLHRAIAEPMFRLDHAAVVVTARGAPMVSGVVLDGWRNGYGRLFWSPVAEDRRYRWEERAVVRARRLARRGLPPDTGPPD